MHPWQGQLSPLIPSQRVVLGPISSSGLQGHLPCSGAGKVTLLSLQFPGIGALLQSQAGFCLRWHHLFPQLRALHVCGHPGGGGS